MDAEDRQERRGEEFMERTEWGSNTESAETSKTMILFILLPTAPHWNRLLVAQQPAGGIRISISTPKGSGNNNNNAPTTSRSFERLPESRDNNIQILTPKGTVLEMKDARSFPRSLLSS
jgi:hypothetical protein